ncbi:siderophore ferric iron reductase [Vibrio sp. SCSIO 43135]|uniref:siderophore ferric iron reductase n=1 Tax=Vibrio sp. SCSIO 43135 TaxID=2819096 RepID=UPI002075A38D|nr:siderophore ferric iron reductase [Vibrio sp. SCSIO 43135]USD40278.1 siderophore ferric iron reductase [Vibrio sp. SCSIO 43135]
MQTDSFFQQLFDYSRQVTPYLEGEVTSCPQDKTGFGLVHIDNDCSGDIQGLYLRLKQENPEAGAAYWLTRTWDLLCWQPMYLAFVSIYACHGLPPLKRIGQGMHANFVAGFSFESHQHTPASQEELIDMAGRDLQELYSFYRQSIDSWTRIRPGFTHHLIADGILGCLIKLQNFVPELTNDYLLAQAQLWFKAFQLPEKLLASLRVDDETGHLKLVRTSCCLVYKCEGRKLCADCPRHPDNKK